MLNIKFLHLRTSRVNWDLLDLWVNSSSSPTSWAEVLTPRISAIQSRLWSSRMEELWLAFLFRFWLCLSLGFCSVCFSLVSLCPNFPFLARTLGFGLMSSLSSVTSSWCDYFCKDAKYRFCTAETKCHRISHRIYGLLTLCSRVRNSEIMAREVMPGYLDATLLWHPYIAEGPGDNSVSSSLFIIFQSHPRQQNFQSLIPS